MKIHNENETYTLHFMFSYKYYTYQIYIDTCNEKKQISKECINLEGYKKHDT